MNNKLPPISEHAIQANFIREAGYEFRNDSTWIPELLYSALQGSWVAGDQGSKQKIGLLNKYFDEGFKRGIPDVHYDQPRGTYSKLVLEFKRADKRNIKNGGLSDDQLIYMNALAPYALVKVVYSEDEAMNALREYMALPDHLRPWQKGLRLERFHNQFKHDREACAICSAMVVSETADA